MTETERLRTELKKTAIPDYMQSSILDYLTGEQPYVGSFLDALLKNDLMTAVMHADSQNIVCLDDWVRFLINHAPSDAWGSRDNVTAWREDHRQPPLCSHHPREVS